MQLASLRPQHPFWQDPLDAVPMHRIEATSSRSRSRHVASVGLAAIVTVGLSRWTPCMLPSSNLPVRGQQLGMRYQEVRRAQHTWTGRRDQRQRGPKVLRRGVPEVALAASVALVGAISRPKTAPGPSASLIKDTKRARAEIEALQNEDLGGKGVTRNRLNKALRRLNNVEAELEAAMDDQDQYPIPKYLEEAANSGKIMLAITGASGVGKSSLVNAFRRLRDSDANAAATGVKETTIEPTMYTFSNKEGIFNQRFYRQLQDDEKLDVGARVVLGQVPGQPEGSCAEVVKVSNAEQSLQVRLESGPVLDIDVEHVVGTALDVVIWDLPGAGTPNFPQATYLRRMGIRYFDVVVLVTSSRFTEAELVLAEELRKFEVPHFMVRNKVDVDIDSEILREEEALEGGDDDESELPKEDKKKIAQQTISCIKTYFSEEYSVDDIYCVSSRRKLRGNHDFPRLEADILEAIRMQRT